MLYEVSNTLLNTPYLGTLDHKKKLCVKMIYRLTALINAESLKKGLPSTNYREYNNLPMYALEMLEREVCRYVQAYFRVLSSPSITVPNEPPPSNEPNEEAPPSNDGDVEEEPIHEPKTATNVPLENGNWTDPNGMWIYGRFGSVTLNTNKNIPSVLDYDDMPYEELKATNGIDYQVTSYAGLLANKTLPNEMTIRNWTNMHITDINSMFNRCSSLTSLDLSSFDTSKVDNMSFMFDGCSSLTKLDLSGFATNEDTIIDMMFQNCMQSVSADSATLTLGKSFTLTGEAILMPPKKDGNIVPLQLTCNKDSYDNLQNSGDWNTLKWTPDGWDDKDNDGLCTFVIEPNA